VRANGGLDGRSKKRRIREIDYGGAAEERQKLGEWGQRIAGNEMLT